MHSIRVSAEADDLTRLRSTGLKAEAMLRSRRARDAAFAGYPDGFGEPAWDELLRPFAETAKGRTSVPARELIAETASHEEISRPYLGWLASHHLVEVDGEDVALTDRGLALMEQYLRGEDRS